MHTIILTVVIMFNPGVNGTIKGGFANIKACEEMKQEYTDYIKGVPGWEIVSAECA